MSFLLPLVAGCALLPAADPEKPMPLRYLRPEKDKYVLESEVTTTRSDDGTVVTSRTERPDEKMTLTLRYDKAGKLISAEALQQEGTRKKAVTLTLGEKGAGTMKRDGLTDFFKDLPANPIVTTAPDWSDVFQLVRRYDGPKGGKQEFPGVWIHPVQGLQQKHTYTVELKDPDTITLKDKEVKLDRYRVKLRGGDYTVWTHGERVVRLQGLAAKAVPVVLEGYEDATKGLKP